MKRSLCLFALVACSTVAPPPAAPPEPPGPPPLLERHATSRGCRGLLIPEDQHFVAQGLCARAIAVDQGPLRGITFSPEGDLVGVTLDGVVRRYRDVNGDGMYRGGPPEIVDWAHTDGNGANCAFDGGYLYCGSIDGVVRFAWDSDAGRAESEPVLTNQPHTGHGAHALAIEGGWLYVSSAAEGNTLSPMPNDYDRRRGILKRFDLGKLEPGKPFSWTDGEIFVRGVRNLAAFSRARPTGG